MTARRNALSPWCVILILKEWNLIEITKNYLKFLLHFLKHGVFIGL